MPKRIQRKRLKGWRMPEGAIYVGRPTMFGNPFTPENCRSAGYTGTDAQIRQLCFDAFRIWIGPNWKDVWNSEISYHTRRRMLKYLPELKGKDLACWCPLQDNNGNAVDCHADVLLKLANVG